MSKRDVRLFLNDMLEAIEKVENYTSDVTFDQFQESDLLIDAVVRNLEIIGEAARYIPTDMRDQYRAIDWSRVVGFRNIVIHEYFDVDLEIVWTIVTMQLSHLKSVLKEMIGP